MLRSDTLNFDASLETRKIQRYFYSIFYLREARQNFVSETQERCHDPVDKMCMSFSTEDASIWSLCFFSSRLTESCIQGSKPKKCSHAHTSPNTRGRPRKKHNEHEGTRDDLPKQHQRASLFQQYCINLKNARKVL